MIFKLFRLKKRQKYIEKNPLLVRDTTYRSRYFKHNKGIKGKLYLCPYCGKFMFNHSKISIDHIDAITRVQKNKRLRKKYVHLEHGVNNIINLTHCCKICNSIKGKKAGLWVFLGRHAKYLMPTLRVLAYIILAYMIIIYLL